ncbi:O157 family O-antigen flippase, partial [Escherichia coli]
YRIISLSVISSLISKILSLLSLILTVSLTLPYLGQERFGVWMTITSLGAALTFLDLGIGNALTNRIAHSFACGKNLKMSRQISGGLTLLAGLSFVITAICYITSGMIDWQLVIKGINENVYAELQHSIKVFVIIFGLGIYSNGVQKVYMGIQKAYISNIVNAIFILLSIITLVISSKLHAGLPVLIVSTLGIQYISGIYLTINLIIKRLIKFTKVNIHAKREAPYLILNGFFFFILQLGTLATWSGDNFIISITLGVTYVAVFSITQRLFQISTVPLTIYNIPLWAAYADAHARNDTQFIKKTLRTSLKIVGISSFLLAFILVVFGSEVVNIWTEGKIQVPRTFIIAYALWSVIDAFSNTFASFLNGLNIVKQQMLAVVTLILIAIPAKYIIV